MIRFAAIGLVFVFAILIYWFSDTARARSISGIFDTLISGDESVNQEAFTRLSLVTVNARRAELGLPALAVDTEIGDSLERFAATYPRTSEIQLDALFRTLQAEFPSAQFLSATLQLNPSEEGLAKAVSEWEDASNPQYQSLSTLAFRDGLRRGCLAVLSHRLPEFDLELANEERGPFMDRCPHCEATHSVTLDQSSRTLILTCPECERPYDLLAVDQQGSFARAPAFLEGFQLPMPLDPNAPKQTKSLMTAIWKAVLDHCDYERDTKGGLGGESWKLPSETWQDAGGDCEDTSILLVDALLSAGIDARVAVGRNIHIGEHAWCVARIGNQQWILESTLEPKAAVNLVPRPLSDAADEYRPEQLFDRQSLYVKADSAKEPHGGVDYWSRETWLPVVPE